MDLIFDIGFNMGDFTKTCNKKIPDCKIIGVEANKLLFPKLKNENFKNLTLINYLVSDIDGQNKKLWIDPNQSGISTASEEFMKHSRFTKGSKYLKNYNSDWTFSIDVKTITLDKLIQKYGNPDIIKIDVEGHEFEVLSGLTKKANKICFECHEEEVEKINNCINHLKYLGYQEYGFIGYIDEGDIYENITFSSIGDPYLVEPRKYVKWETLKKDIDQSFNENRRVNYGMMWVK